MEVEGGVFVGVGFRIVQRKCMQIVCAWGERSIVFFIVHTIRLLDRYGISDIF
jgi:hypothetical protein